MLAFEWTRNHFPKKEQNNALYILFQLAEYSLDVDSASFLSNPFYIRSGWDEL